MSQFRRKLSIFLAVTSALIIILVIVSQIYSPSWGYNGIYESNENGERYYIIEEGILTELIIYNYKLKYIDNIKIILVSYGKWRGSHPVFGEYTIVNTEEHLALLRKNTLETEEFKLTKLSNPVRVLYVKIVQWIN